jgi:hypothetical protein
MIKSPEKAKTKPRNQYQEEINIEFSVRKLATIM